MTEELHYAPHMEAAQLTAIHHQTLNNDVRLNFDSVLSRVAFERRLTAELCTPLTPGMPVRAEGTSLTFLTR